MSDKSPRPAMMGFQTNTATLDVVRTVMQEPQSLWPSGRGTEIGTAAVSFPTLLARVRRLAKTAHWRASVFADPGEGYSALIFEGFAGQRAVTLVAEDHLAKGMVAIVADVAADASAVLRAVSGIVGKDAGLRASPPERSV